MVKRIVRTWFCLMGALAVGASAQEPKKVSSDLEQAKSLWEPQTMMQQACDGIAVHYKLDARQKDFTCNLLTERVTRFLGKHEKEFWPLLMELTEYQLQGKQPDGETAQTIGRRGSPLFQDARNEIMKAQDDFRQILTDEQKAIHDKDLKGLNHQMSSIEQQFQNWSEGKPGSRIPLSDVQIGPPGAGGKFMPVPLRQNKITRESEWERYVKRFIENYRLDETQKAAALAVWKGLEEQAVQYRKSHQKELEEADKRVRDAQLAKPFDKDILDGAKRIQQSLNKPFEDWFTELKTRLEQIPTEKQRAEYQERLKTKPAIPPQQPTTQPTSKPSEPPAKTEPGPKKEPAPSATPQPSGGQTKPEPPAPTKPDGK